MRQPQNRFLCADERAARGTLLRIVAGLNLHFGNLQIPVTKVIPHKLVNAAGHVVQAVIFKAFGNISFNTLQG